MEKALYYIRVKEIASRVVLRKIEEVINEKFKEELFKKLKEISDKWVKDRLLKKVRNITSKFKTGKSINLEI